MPARAVWRRLCAVVPLTLGALLASAFLLAPGASAAGPDGLAGSAPVGRQLDQKLQHDALPPLAVRINHAANVAIAQLGDPYRYGAAGPNAFDCSGLSMWSYGHARLHLPRTAAGQYAAVHHISKAQLRRGDLVFFHTSSGHVYHVGIFLYWNAVHRAVIIHSPYPGRYVHREPVWTTSWYAGTRRP